MEVSLIDPAGTYQGTTPIPVFHTPVLDEKDTEYWEGFDPEGKPIQETFSMDGFQRADPFFCIHYDDEFFDKEGNRPTTAMAPPFPKVRPTFFAGLDPVLSLLVKPALAHHPPGHSALPDCYHERSGYLTRFSFTNDHESVTSPERPNLP